MNSLLILYTSAIGLLGMSLRPCTWA